jgi:hypothetical protein
MIYPLPLWRPMAELKVLILVHLVVPFAAADSASSSEFSHPTQFSRLPFLLARSVKGHEERFPPTRLSAGCGFRKETIAGMRRNERDAPEADLSPKAAQPE